MLMIAPKQHYLYNLLSIWLINCIEVKVVQLIHALKQANDKFGQWVFRLSDFMALFPKLSPASLRVALHKAVQQELLVRVGAGVYLNPFARSLPDNVLEALIDHLRQQSFNYLSLESVLSEAGYISQIPSRLTVMTTGRSGTFKTPFGVIEFTHTARNESRLRTSVPWDSDRKIHIAPPEIALRDLRRVGRNLDLIEYPEDDDWKEASGDD